MFFPIWIILQWISKAAHPPLLTEQQITASHSDCAGWKLFCALSQFHNKSTRQVTNWLLALSQSWSLLLFSKADHVVRWSFVLPSMGLHCAVFHQWDDELAGKKMSQYILPLGHGSNLPWFPWWESEVAQLHYCKLAKPYWHRWNDWIWPIALLLCF